MTRIETTADPGVVEVPAIMNIGQVAEMLEVSVRTVERYVRERKLPCRYMGGQRRFFAAEVIQWLDRRRSRHVLRRKEGLPHKRRPRRSPPGSAQ